MPSAVIPCPFISCFSGLFVTSLLGKLVSVIPKKSFPLMEKVADVLSKP